MMAADSTESRTGAVSRRTVLAAGGTALGLVTAGCMSDENPNEGSGGSDGNGGGGDGSGDIVVTGSSTVYPVSVAMAEEFQRENDANVSVDSTGTGGGFENHFAPGNSDINGASRPITDEEQQTAEDNGVTPIEFEIGGDALTVATNNDAGWVDCVSFDELAQIWQPNGAETWAEVNSDWPDEPFELYGAASTSGTFDWFTENVVGEQGSHRSDYEATEEDNLIVQGIEGSQYAMGYFGYAYYAENQDRIKALEIEESEGDGCAPPGLETAQDDSYPMSRPLYIYVAESSLENSAVEEFVRYYLETAGTELVSDVGYVPASEEQVERNLSTLDDAVGGN